MLKKALQVVALVCLTALVSSAQNLTTVSGSNIMDLNGAKLAAGQICFVGTDQQNQPISFSVGGGGQALRRGYCSAVTAGVITSFTVPNPGATSPTGIYYHIKVNDGGQTVLDYTLVSFTGATFNFDNYAPMNLAQGAPLTGTSVTGNLSVTGNVAATGTVTGSNIAGGQIATGVGTTNTLPKYTNGASAVIGNSSISDNGTTVSTSEAMTALSLNLNSTGVLSTTAQSGTGSHCMTTSCVMTTPNIGAATGSSINLNGAAAGTGAALTVGGTSSTTGGISLFVGAAGGQNERLAVVPADGSAAAARVGALSVRLLSAGFLTGSQVAGISSAGVLSLSTSTGTLPATIANDTAGGITFANNAGGSFQFGNGGTIFMNVLGGGIRWSGATSGTTVLAATAIAGAGTLSLPPNVNDTLVARTTTDTLTNKTIATPVQGAACQGNCIVTVPGYARAVGQTAAIAATTIFTTGGADTLYLVQMSVNCKLASASATVVGNITWTDVSGTVLTGPTSTATCTTLNINAQGGTTVAIQAKAGTNIQYSAAITNTPTYDIRVAVTQMGTN